MHNAEIAKILITISYYLEMEDKPNFFRIRAFKNASDYIEKYPTDLTKKTYKQLVALPYIGDSIAKDIVVFAETGKIPFYEELKKNSPIKLEELLQVQQVGPKKIKTFYKKLGITNLKQLQITTISN